MKISGAKIGRGKDYLSFAILECVTDKAMKTVEAREDIEILLSFNGENIPVEKFFARLEDQHQEMVQRAAQELLKEAFDERTEGIIRSLDKLQEELAAKIGPSRNEDF